MTFRTILGSFLDVLYPPTCTSCGRLLNASECHICLPCWSQVVPVRDHPMLIAEASEKMGPDIHAVVSGYVFQKTGPLQSLVHALKYQNADQIGVWLGERLAEEAASKLEGIDLVMPVPLHRAKERERGYNQAAMIARGLTSRTDARLETRALRRVRHTPSQTKLSIEQRRVNMAEAFVVDGDLELKGATVMVVDDVITTGATIASCGHVLLDAGVARVIAGSVALADHDA